MKYFTSLLATSALCAGAASAAEIEITHWWTSGGEAAAVAELAEAFNATGHTWIDGAIAGSGSTARPIMVSRITGGDPMAATQFNHGQQAQELVQAGLMRSLESVASADGWRDIINPPSLLDACTLDGEIYCVPLNVHSWAWMWLSNAAFEKAGVDVPTNWDEFVAAGPALREAGIQPLVVGQQPWQAGGVFGVILPSVGGPDLYNRIYGEKDTDAIDSPEMDKVLQALADARDLATGSSVSDWNLATAMLINGTGGAQIMGDWAQGEFAVAGLVAGEDYSCLPGLGMADIVTTSGDAFYFPAVDDPEVSAAQEALARVMLSPEAQVAFNSKKGSMPVRGDVELEASNECMRRGLDILANGTAIKGGDELLSPDALNQVNDLVAQYFSEPDMTSETVRDRLKDIIGFAF